MDLNANENMENDVDGNLDNNICNGQVGNEDAEHDEQLRRHSQRNRKVTSKFHDFVMYCQYEVLSSLAITFCI